MNTAGSSSLGRGCVSAGYLSKAHCLQDAQFNPQAFQLLNLGHPHINKTEPEGLKHGLSLIHHSLGLNTEVSKKKKNIIYIYTSLQKENHAATDHLRTVCSNTVLLPWIQSVSSI